MFWQINFMSHNQVLFIRFMLSHVSIYIHQSWYADKQSSYQLLAKLRSWCFIKYACMYVGFLRENKNSGAQLCQTIILLFCFIVYLFPKSSLGQNLKYFMLYFYGDCIWSCCYIWHITDSWFFWIFSSGIKC